ncbi:MAG: hypothetical protein IKF51_06290 [Solobacterium sp.]|nr:hypothetical protein [Solobacterium sp.]
MKRNGIIALLYRMFSAAMFFVCLYGIFALAVLSPQASAARNDIETMLKDNQKTETVRRMIRLRQKTLEENSGNFKTDSGIRDQILTAGTGSTYVPAALRYTDARQMEVVGVGDSVMVSGLDALYATFPNGYFDALFGRTIYAGIEVLRSLEQSGHLGDVLVFSLGANSYISEDDCEELIRLSDGRPVFFVSAYGVSNDSNDVMKRVIARHPDAYYIDWESVAFPNRARYILSDGLHLTQEGAVVYSNLIADEITRELITNE